MRSSSSASVYQPPMGIAQPSPMPLQIPAVGGNSGTAESSLMEVDPAVQFEEIGQDVPVPPRPATPSLYPTQQEKSRAYIEGKPNSSPYFDPEATERPSSSFPIPSPSASQSKFPYPLPRMLFTPTSRLATSGSSNSRSSFMPQPALGSSSSLRSTPRNIGSTGHQPLGSSRSRGLPPPSSTRLNLQERLLTPKSSPFPSRVQRTQLFASSPSPLTRNSSRNGNNHRDTRPPPALSPNSRSEQDIPFDSPNAVRRIDFARLSLGDTNTFSSVEAPKLGKEPENRLSPYPKPPSASQHSAYSDPFHVNGA